MTKSEFIRKFAEDNNTTYVLAEQWINAVFDQLAREIVDNKRVEIRGLGTWTHQRYTGRTARNFATGKEMHLADTISIKFKLSKALTKEMHETYPAE